MAKGDAPEYDEKSVTVLDDIRDVESVLARYKKKGWEIVHHSKPKPGKSEPATVVLHLQRVKRAST